MLANQANQIILKKLSKDSVVIKFISRASINRVNLEECYHVDTEPFLGRKESCTNQILYDLLCEITWQNSTLFTKN